MKGIDIEVVPGVHAMAEYTGNWHLIQNNVPGLSSPFFRPEFITAVARAREDVEVAIIRRNDAIIAFFPFQRETPHSALPAGYPLSDYHGLIGCTDSTISVPQLLKACDLREWRYNHLPLSQSAFPSADQTHAVSPVIDTAQSYEQYVTEIKKRSSEYTQAMRKLRALEREIGPVEFVPLSRDTSLLQTLIDWKSQQYQKTGARDMFQESWFRRVVEGTFSYDTSNFRGALSVLSAGGQPVAIHYGLISGSVWHYWFPAYDPEFSKYSPGLNLLLMMVQDAGPRGIEVIDLGKGHNVRYKDTLKSYEIPLAEGSVCRPSINYYWRRVKKRLRTLKRLLP
jgi:CelD/BcsL family acetyltransferase involved in cellulose biosynthesis